MKTAFKPSRGRVYHVVHETKTGSARKSAWTICGQHFEDGERSTHQPTCPECAKLDNPLMLSQEDRQYLQAIIQLGKWKDAPKAKSYERLRERDLIDANVRLTRRGSILAEDWSPAGPVPMPDTEGVVHARAELDMYPRCAKNGRLDGVNQMSVSRYEKLRKLEEIAVITCLSCLGK
jgi:hypothetical protein